MAEELLHRLFRWPEPGRIAKPIPKERLYSEASASTSLKQRFVTEVKQIRWEYKLGKESLPLKPTKTVQEIQVFVIDLKGASLDTSVLSAIDRSIPSPIIFELRRDDGLWAEQRMAAAFKRKGKAGTKLGEYFRTGWVRLDEERLPLPTALDLEGLYTQLLGALLPTGLRPGEGLSEATGRIEEARKLEREIASLERKLRTEPQLNRKVELRRTLKDRQAALAALA